jgi:hypothetical protein
VHPNEAGEASHRRWSRRTSTYNTTFLTPPTVPTLATIDVETGVKLEEEWIWQTLGEHVGELRSHRDMQNVNFPNDDLVMDGVEINLNMLRVLMLNRVGRQVETLTLSQ